MPLLACQEVKGVGASQVLQDEARRAAGQPGAGVAPDVRELSRIFYDETRRSRRNEKLSMWLGIGSFAIAAAGLWFTWRRLRLDERR